MDIKYKDNNLIVTGLKDFNIRHIFDCGQCFRFNRIDDNTYFGIAKGKALKISQSGDEVTFFNTSEKDFAETWYDYFDLGRDYGSIKAVLSRDSVMKEAISYGGGIRILNQDLWESVISFIISASNNIPRIKGIIELFCNAYGDKIEYMGNTYYSFPDISKTASLTKDDLAVIRAGYRDKYIMDAALKFKSGDLSEEYIKSLSTPDAKKRSYVNKGRGKQGKRLHTSFRSGKSRLFPH